MEKAINCAASSLVVKVAKENLTDLPYSIHMSRNVNSSLLYSIYIYICIRICMYMYIPILICMSTEIYNYIYMLTYLY